MSRGPTGAKLDGGITPMPGYRLTVASEKRKWIVCSNQCDTCPLYLNGCAGNCIRFPTDVCADCPCRASPDRGNVNEALSCPILVLLEEKKGDAEV